VHVDREACPWLISRFVDQDAVFLFAPKSKVLETAEREGAIAFDTPGAELHHRGDLCTFDVVIEAYNLADKALHRRMGTPGLALFARDIQEPESAKTARS
jgi:hypothetical protein